MANVFGSEVDDAIQREFFPNGQDLGGPAGVPGANDSLRSTALALGIVERHLVPVTSENLAGLAILKHILGGSTFQSIAEDWVAMHQLRGGHGPLIEALEYTSMIRQFKGVSGSLFGGRKGLFGAGRVPGGDAR